MKRSISLPSWTAILFLTIAFALTSCNKPENTWESFNLQLECRSRTGDLDEVSRTLVIFSQTYTMESRPMGRAYNSAQPSLYAFVFSLLQVPVRCIILDGTNQGTLVYPVNLPQRPDDMEWSEWKSPRWICSDYNMANAIAAQNPPPTHDKTSTFEVRYRLRRADHQAR